MENKFAYLLVECTDWDTIYRVLLFEDNINSDDVQKAIYDIKIKWLEEDYDGWNVDELLEELSTIYDFIDLGDPLYVEC